jgi:hypothetical protein
MRFRVRKMGGWKPTALHAVGRFYARPLEAEQPTLAPVLEGYKARRTSTAAEASELS